jgi:hypothetical protein
MTHVLNFALRQVLDADVDQRGSLVAEDKLRFDFTAKKALTPEQLKRVEDLVNEQIEQKLVVDDQLVPLKEAQAVSGVRAVFGETCVAERASEAAYQGGGSMMTYKTGTGHTIMRVAGSATSAMRKPQSLKRVRNDEA